MKRQLTEVDLHLTNRCNQECIHCSYDSGVRRYSELGRERLCRLICEASALGAKELHLTGGEPLLSDSVFDVIAAAKTHGLHTRLQTNGGVMDRETAERLKDSGIDSVMVSVDGISPEEHDAIRQCGGSFDRALACIETLKSMGIPVRANSVIMRANMGHPEEFLALSRNLALPIHSFFVFSPIGRGKDKGNEVPSASEWQNFKERIFEDVRRHNDKRDIIVEIGYVPDTERALVENLQNLLPCKMLKRNYSIVRCDGKLFPCVFFAHSRYAIGDISKGDFAREWFDGHWDRYRFLDKIAADGCCRFGFARCVACKAINFQVDGDLFASRDPRCFKTDGHIPLCPMIKVNARNNEVSSSCMEMIDDL